MSEKLLTGRTALITGAGSGIGQAIAEAYAHQGAEVIAADRNLGKAKKTAESIPQGKALELDVTDPAAVEQAIGDIERRERSVDILVNSHGILTQGTVSELSLEQWKETLDIDLTGVFLTCRAVIPRMVQQRWGRIINISSQLAIKGGVSVAHYAAAKAGVIGLTKSIALEVSSHGVLANVIAPGPIVTPLTDAMTTSWKEQKKNELPIARFGYAAEVAPTAVLLASDPGGNLYTGQTLGPNGGDVMP